MDGGRSTLIAAVPPSPIVNLTLQRIPGSCNWWSWPVPGIHLRLLCGRLSSLRAARTCL